MARTGRVRVFFDGDTSRLDRATGHAERRVRRFGTATQSASLVAGRSFGYLARRAVAAGAAVTGTYGAFAILRQSFGEFEESLKATRQTEAVLKSTGNAANITAKEVANLADAISLKAGIDDEAIQKSENLLLTFRDVRNEVGQGNDIFNQATTAVVDMSVAMDKDLKSTSIAVGKALQDPIRGATALRRVGVQLTEQQEDQIKTFVESGDKLSAQKIILRELSKEFEGSAAAQATSSQKLRVAFQNLEESLGRAFGPALSSAAGGLADFITQMRTGEGAGGRYP